MKQLELELRFLKHVTTSAAALEKAISWRITEEHLNAKEEGSNLSYTKAIYKSILKYHKDSGGSIMTDFNFQNRVSELEEKFRQPIMLMWTKMQQEEYDENEQHEILNQIKMSQAMRLVKKATVEGKDILLSTGVQNWLIHQEKSHIKIREELSLENPEQESFDFANAADFFKEDYSLRRDHPELYEGIPIGVKEVDFAWGGLKKGALYTILAPTGGGKSIFLLNFAHHAWMNGKNVLYLSFELMKDQCLYRHMSLAFGIPFWKFHKIKLTDEEFETGINLLNKGNEKDSYFHYSVPVNDRTPEYVESKIKDLVAEGRPMPDLIVADYVGEMTTRALLESNREVDLWKRSEAAAEGLWKLGLKTGIAVLTAGQFNQDTAKDRNKSLREGKLMIYDTTAAAGSKKLTDRSHAVIVADPDWNAKRTTLYCVKERYGNRFTPMGVQVDPDFNRVIELPEEDQKAWREIKGIEVATRSINSDEETDSHVSSTHVFSDPEGVIAKEDWGDDAERTDVNDMDMSDFDLLL